MEAAGMTLFAAAIRLLGLSQAEAADYLGVSLDTLKPWCKGRRTPPPGTWTELRALYDTQCEAAEAALALIEEAQPDELTLNTNGPRGTEWPTKSAHMAALARVALESDLPVGRAD